MIAMSDEERMPDPIAIIPHLSPGSALILRHYNTPNRQTLAKDLAPLCQRWGIKLLIANDARLARAVQADGLHLSENALHRGPQLWRQICAPHWLITAAAHSPAALLRAARTGAHAALLAPVFPTASHPERPHIGLHRLAQWSQISPLPVYALGGIGHATVRRLKNCKIAGIAGIGGFMP